MSNQYLQYSINSSSKNVLSAATWTPGNIGGNFSTFAQIYQFISSQNSPSTIFLNRYTDLEPTLTVPIGTWELNNVSFTTKRYGNPGINQLIISNGAVIRNLGELSRSCSLNFMSDSPSIEIDLLSSDSPSILFFGLGSFISNNGNSPCYVSADNSFTVIVLEGATIVPGLNSQPIVQLGTNAQCLLRIDLGGGIPDSGISGPAGSMIVLSHDGGFKFTTTGLIFTNFFGTIINKPYGVAGGSGPTLFRPDTSDVTDLPSIGCYYFDTDLGYSVNWNGANWVDSTGAIV